jgi:hypothetical protein
MIGQAEIIVGGKIQENLAADLDARALGGIHPAQFAEQILFAQGGEARLQDFIERRHVENLRFTIHDLRAESRAAQQS